MSNLYRPLRTFLFLVTASVTGWTAPPVGTFTAVPIVLGNAVTLKANVADADADMDYVSFIILSGPGISTALALSPDVIVPGPGTATQQTGVTVQKNWSPYAAGIYTARATIHSLNGSLSLDQEFEVFAGNRTILSHTVPSGAIELFTSPGEMVTAENQTQSSVVVQNGGSLILWAGGRVVLKPGFRAEHGSFFWAAVDHDSDGYSDVEEATDFDGDGMFDAWEVDHGLNMTSSADRNTDLDMDGTTNINEFAAGRDPDDRADGLGLPAGFDLVLKVSTAYYGVKPDWTITPVAAPL